MDVEEQTTENHENEAAVSPVTTATRANEVQNETVASMEVDSVAAGTSEVAAEAPTTSGNAEQQQQNDQHDNEMVDAMSAMPMPVSSPLQPVANDDQNPEIEDNPEIEEPVREENFELAAENLEAEVEAEEEPPYSPEPYPMADAMGYDTDNSDGGGENVPELGNELDVPYENAQGNVEMAEAVNVEAGGEAVNDPTWHASRPYVRGALRTLIRQTRQDGQGLAAFLNRENRMQYLRHILFIADFQNRHGSRRERPHNGVPGDVSTDDDDSSGSGSEDAEGSSHVEHDINISFDTNLPAEHSYLGSNMERVSGVNYIEASQHYRLMLFKHEHILFPGEILPFMLSGSVIENEIDVQNGLLFGVCFPFLRKKEEEEKLYGVTCQIYEKGRDELGKSVFKSRALQRFVTKASYLKGPLQFIAHSTIRCYGDVKILPEIYLPEPYKLMNMGSLKRFLGLPSMEYKLKRMHAAASPLPQHFYEKYNINHVVEKARAVFAAQKLDTMPSDPVQQSFWLVRNLHLSEELTNLIFTLDSVNKRMEVIGNSFEKDAVFVCRFCSKKIAHCRELFAMSKHGVQTQYCNSAGYIHETNTVYNVCRNAILYTGEPSSEFSWFPSYQWQIIICKLCSHHIGWKYSTDEPNLEPKTFFGITSTSVRITTAYTEPPPRDDFYRMLLQQIVPNSTP